MHRRRSRGESYYGRTLGRISYIRHHTLEERGSQRASHWGFISGRGAWDIVTLCDTHVLLQHRVNPRQ